jgi:hypothetical protein
VNTGTREHANKGTGVRRCIGRVADAAGIDKAKPIPDLSFTDCARFVERGEGQQNNEGPCIGKEDLREVQGHHPQGSRKGDLRERKAQAAPGLTRPGGSYELPKKGSDVRDQGSEKRSLHQQNALTPEP